MNNVQLDDVKSTLARTMDPFTKKLMGASGDQIVSTMPNKMIEWIRSTSLYYASN